MSHCTSQQNGKKKKSNKTKKTIHHFLWNFLEKPLYYLWSFLFFSVVPFIPKYYNNLPTTSNHSVSIKFCHNKEFNKNWRQKKNKNMFLFAVCAIHQLDDFTKETCKTNKQRKTHTNRIKVRQNNNQVKSVERGKIISSLIKTQD
ncbi:hypothetical protein RFI_34317 [Reticulomyxa filosa]|uniref:Uncharacterized protein n=1 Tax=Reticulomyxa filosa TaxID=46433 RepID=X6LPM1_RETFI|nr:hypothetical protein RFI_34317 [Reticulomyxa filosa]|eukprot:ETO03092.1 hypothetical protein RFI_34317 [Reticulomyxa filosa]